MGWLIFFVFLFFYFVRALSGGWSEGASVRFGGEVIWFGLVRFALCLIFGWVQRFPKLVGDLVPAGLG